MFSSPSRVTVGNSMSAVVSFSRSIMLYPSIPPFLAHPCLASTSARSGISLALTGIFVCPFEHLKHLPGNRIPRSIPCNRIALLFSDFSKVVSDLHRLCYEPKVHITAPLRIYFGFHGIPGGLASNHTDFPA